MPWLTAIGACAFFVSIVSFLLLVQIYVCARNIVQREDGRKVCPRFMGFYIFLASCVVVHKAFDVVLGVILMYIVKRCVCECGL